MGHLNEELDEELLSEAEMLHKTIKRLKTKTNFLDLLRWTDRFYKAYVRLGENNGHLTEQMKEDAKTARIFIRRLILQWMLSLCLYHTQSEEIKEEK